MHSKKHWAPGEGVTVDRVVSAGIGGWIVCGSLVPQGVCPECGVRSQRRHGWRQRCLQDYPAHGEAVTVDLRVCRWRCTTPSCRRETFSDPASSAAAPYARQTLRAVQIASHLGHVAGGRPAERLMRRLGIPVSDDTILRHLKRDAKRNAPPARIIGIDDWSWRRSTRYGTIIVDLERRSVVDVLEDRNAASCTAWLQNHPSIEVVSRDRCGLYAQAVRQGAPQALQVADRFHLIQNLRVAVEEQMNMSGRATGRALLSEADHINAALHRHRARPTHRQSRAEVFASIHALRDTGLSCSEIERRTGYRRRSVAKWLALKTPPDRQRATLTPTSPWYFEDFLAQSWEAGNRRGRQLFHEVKQRGYSGSFSHLERLLSAWRRAEKPTLRDPLLIAPAFAPIRDPDTGHLLSPVVAAALCIKPRGLLTAAQDRKVDALKKGSPDFAAMRRLAMRFRGILRGRQSDALDAWIQDAIATNLIPIMRFARVLNRDIEAVYNAIELPWSNGQAEGQINRLKTIKRAMYGRAGPELLRARMLPLRHTNWGRT